MMKILALNTRLSVLDIAKKLNMSERTGYRYLKTLRQAGYKVRRRYGSVYTIDDDPNELELQKLAEDTGKPAKQEAGIIVQKPCQNLLVGRDTYEVMEQMDKKKILDDAPYLKQVVANVTLLQNAAQDGKKVEVSYDSCSWGRRAKRILEPFTFFFYYNYVWCFDCEHGRNMPLRVSRMGDVRILDEKSTNSQKHRKQIVDAFGCWGHYTKHVKLRLSMQAHNLMIEAHPISMITMREDTDYPDGEKWILETGVCEYSGITRYIMGMLDEIEILEGEGLKEYIEAWREKINAVQL